jgi:hypothetical protein
LVRDSQWARAHDDVALRIVLNALVPVAKAASSKIACHRLSDNAYVPRAGWARFWVMSLSSTDTIPVNDYGK